MKKCNILILILALALSLCACRIKNDVQPTETQPQATQENTMPDVLPSIDPTMDTNIPDPTVDSNSNTMNDGFATDNTEPDTQENHNTVDPSDPSENGRTRFRHYGRSE